MIIKVCSLRNSKMVNAYDVRVDRASVLGNPFFMRSESERELVCRKYEQYFYDKVTQQDRAFMAELNRLLNILKQYGEIRLFCWCAPKQCHAETIKRYLEDIVKIENNIKL